MKKIDISTPKFPNTFALVDDGDYEDLNKHKWGADKWKQEGIYAIRNISVGSKQMSLKMHVAIMGRMAGKEIDHRNRNTLDNQRHNLRHCTKAENLRNRGANRNNTSGYKGVHWRKDMKKWQAQITCNRKRIHLGYFFCLIKAAKAYDMGAIKYHGEFARTNFAPVAA